MGLGVLGPYRVDQGILELASVIWECRSCLGPQGAWSRIEAHRASRFRVSGVGFRGLGV